MVFLKINYGPYEMNGIIRHKKQRLYGLTEKLEAMGYDVKLKPSVLYNRMTIEMLGRDIFRCKLTSLKFNTKYEDDHLCAKIADFIEEAKSRFYAPTNIPHSASSKFRRSVNESTLVCQK